MFPYLYAEHLAQCPTHSRYSLKPSHFNIVKWLNGWRMKSICWIRPWERRFEDSNHFLQILEGLSGTIKIRCLLYEPKEYKWKKRRKSAKMSASQQLHLTIIAHIWAFCWGVTNVRMHNSYMSTCLFHKTYFSWLYFSKIVLLLL